MKYILKFNKFNMKLVNENIKNTYLNHLLDKLSDGKRLNTSQLYFLNNIDDIKDIHIKDHKYKTNYDTYLMIMDILDNKINIRYGIKDDVDSFGENIIKIYRNNDDKIIIKLENNKEKEIKDNFLYNMIFNIDRFEYELVEQDEYFEKIPLKND